MRDGPDIARIASLIGDPARASMLSALMTGKALTASELATEAGVGLPTASSHLAKLTEGGLLSVAAQGRHRYYGLSNPQVAAMLEVIMGVAVAVGPKRVRPGPRDASMREARICYDHLAGEQAVAMLDSFLSRGLVRNDNGSLALAESGQTFFSAIGIDPSTPAGSRRPLCKACLDWSARRAHLAGSLDASILDKILKEGWARRDGRSRAILFSPNGKRLFERTFLRSG